MSENNGEFKGTVKEAIADLKEDVGEIKLDVRSLNKRFWILLIIGSLALADYVPDLLKVAFASPLK